MRLQLQRRKQGIKTTYEVHKSFSRTTHGQGFSPAKLNTPILFRAIHRLSHFSYLPEICVMLHKTSPAHEEMPSRRPAMNDARDAASSIELLASRKHERRKESLYPRFSVPDYDNSSPCDDLAGYVTPNQRRVLFGDAGSPPRSASNQLCVIDSARQFMS